MPAAFIIPERKHTRLVPLFNKQPVQGEGVIRRTRLPILSGCSARHWLKLKAWQIRACHKHKHSNKISHQNLTSSRVTSAFYKDRHKKSGQICVLSGGISVSCTDVWSNQSPSVSKGAGGSGSTWLVSLVLGVQGFASFDFPCSGNSDTVNALWNAGSGCACIKECNDYSRQKGEQTQVLSN